VQTDATQKPKPKPEKNNQKKLKTIKNPPKKKAKKAQQ
jgi:hypothetical protein